VIRVDARASFVRGRLVAQRRAPKVPAGDSPDPDPFDRVRGLDASLRWDSVTNRSRRSRKCPRIPRKCSSSLDHVSDVPRVIPHSACSGAALEPFRGPSLQTPDQLWARSPSALGWLSNPSEGPTFKPLISNGREARVLWGGCRNPSEGPAFEPLISRRARGPLPSPRRILSETSPFPVPVAREREEGKDMYLNKVAHLF
jgi:hypothetical protein